MLHTWTLNSTLLVSLAGDSRRDEREGEGDWQRKGERRDPGRLRCMGMETERVWKRQIDRGK